MNSLLSSHMGPLQAPGSLKTQAMQGAVWTVGGYGTSQALRLFSHLVLAWYLEPEIFGLMALVMVLMHGLAMFSDVGIQPSIIQSSRGHEAKFLNTAWTIQAIRGILLWCIASLLAWPFASFYAKNDPSAAQLVYLIPVAALTALIQGFQSTALATLSKELRFARLTLLGLGSQLVGLVAMTAGAIFFGSIWAIVFGMLLTELLKTIASHWLVPNYSVKFAWDKACFSELSRYGKWIFLSTAFTFLGGNLDRLILGNLLSLAELGLYSIAFTFCQVPLNISTRIGSSVLFPVYSKHKHDPVRMMEISLRGREVALLAGGGVCLSMAIGSRLFFNTLWDERYAGIAPIAQWMVIYVWAVILLETIDRIPLALGNSRALFTCNVVRSLGMLLALPGYWLGGLAGFILGLAAGTLLAQVQLLPSLPARRKEVLRQGFAITLALIAYGFPAVLLTEFLASQIDFRLWACVVVVCATVPLAASGYFVWSSFKGVGVSIAAGSGAWQRTIARDRNS